MIEYPGLIEVISVGVVIGGLILAAMLLWLYALYFSVMKIVDRWGELGGVVVLVGGALILLTELAFVVFLLPFGYAYYESRLRKKETPHLETDVPF